MGDVNKKSKALAESVGSLAGKLTILGAAGVWGFKRQFIDTASEFEQFTAILETVEGSSDKAAKSMAWVSDFAAKTPYELGEVTDAFVKLRAYGMEPMNGLLKAVGDTASAMGKPLMQGVEAIAEAVTGEYERLKEFGIKAETKGNRVRFSYTDAAGKQQYKTVNKNNRAMIQGTLEAIWNARYAGAMEKQSRTWRGMISNLSDQWTRFKVKVMQAGLFDWMKGKLTDLLALVDRMAADGSLQRYAEMWSKKILSGMKEAWRMGVYLWDGFKKGKGALDKLAEALGGYDNLLKAVAATIAVKFLVQIGSLAVSLVSLASTAIPAVISAVNSLTVSVSALWVALAPVLAGLAIVAAAKVGSEAVGKAISEHQVAGMSTDTLKAMQARNDVMGGGPQTYQSRIIRTELAAREAEQELKAKLEITVKDDRLKITHLSSDKRFDVEADTGRLMVAH
ncbi:MAG TPA: hypothetical protein DC063_00290 [Arenimonas sp.]|nr:hypothetical protein [Arenimonas sp.]